jgi:hypothetical protein
VEGKTKGQRALRSDDEVTNVALLPYEDDEAPKRVYGRKKESLRR